MTHTLPTTARDGDLRAALEHLANCADPFGQCVFDDNGDITVTSHQLTSGEWFRLRRAARRAREVIASSPAQDPVPALGAPAGEIEGLRALSDYITQLGQVEFQMACEAYVRTHVLAPPASAADGEGLLDAVCRIIHEGYPQEEDSPFPYEAETARRLNERAREKADAILALLPTSPPPVPPSRVAGLDRAKNWNLGAELSRPVSTWSFDAPTTGETPGQDAVAAAIEALEPFAAVAEHDIGSDETDTDVFRPMDGFNRAPRLTVGHLRLARTALASLRSTQADTGGESQTPAPAGDVVEAGAGERLAEIEGLFAEHEKARGRPPSGRLVDQVRAALAAIAQGPGAGQAVPEGWRLVPAEPTKEMVEAAVDDSTLWSDAHRPVLLRGYDRIYRLMLAAAPLPAAPATAASEGDGA